MSMLAEKRAKRKWCVNPNGRDWSNDDNKFGQRMLEKMGWKKGCGLGVKLQGMKEHVKVSAKNDTKGLGCKNSDTEWIRQQENFETLLTKLSATAPSGTSESKLGNAVPVSLEEKSKKSRVRVHYQKFTRGKDVSRYSADDLSCILGKKIISQDDRTIEIIGSRSHSSMHNISEIDSKSQLTSEAARKHGKQTGILKEISNVHEVSVTCESVTDDYVLSEVDDGFINHTVPILINKEKVKKKKKICNVPETHQEICADANISKSKFHFACKESPDSNDEILGTVALFLTRASEEVGSVNVDAKVMVKNEKKKKKKMKKKEKRRGKDMQEGGKQVEEEENNMEEVIEMEETEVKEKKRKKKKKQCKLDIGNLGKSVTHTEYNLDGEEIVSGELACTNTGVELKTDQIERKRKKMCRKYESFSFQYLEDDYGREKSKRKKAKENMRSSSNIYVSNNDVPIIADCLSQNENPEENPTQITIDVASRPFSSECDPLPSSRPASNQEKAAVKHNSATVNRKKIPKGELNLLKKQCATSFKGSNLESILGYGCNK